MTDKINHGKVDNENHTENSSLNPDPKKSKGELTEGRPDPTPDVRTGEYPTVQQGSYSRDVSPSESDHTTLGDEAQCRRDRMSKQEESEGDDLGFPPGDESKFG
jgi:hypothetical protein